MPNHNMQLLGTAVGAALLGAAAGALMAWKMLLRWAPPPPPLRDPFSPQVGSPPHPQWKPPQRQPPPFPISGEHHLVKPNQQTDSLAPLTESPAPSYATSSAPSSPCIHVDPSQQPVSTLYPLVISAVVPRPIAFISTASKSGARNLSPYSYFNAVSHDPPILAVGHCWSKGKPKDSLTNVLETGEFVVSLISDWFVEAANHTCGPYPRGMDEMELAGLTPLPSLKVSPPGVAESGVNMECRVRHTYDVKNSSGDTTTTVVLGEVVMFHFSPHVVARTKNSGKLIVDPVKLRPLCRLGGNTFASISTLFDIPRPDGEGRYPGEGSFAPSDRDRVLQS